MFELNNTVTAQFPYRLLERVGEGAMGVVFRALEPALNRQVAIKFLHPRVAADQSETVAEEIRSRFLQEAQAAAALSHPSVVTIYRIGEEFGSPFIAMEWLDGEALDARLERGALPQAEVVRLGGELLEALQLAHGSGMVHRDIKPANLVLLANGRLKVVDFGIAHLHDSELVKTQAGMLIGTPQYASPEQIQGLAVDARSDLYSAALVLYVLLAGRHPFAGQNMVSLLSSIVHTDPPDLRAVVPGLPAALAAMIQKGMSKDRDERFATAAEMAAALAASVAGDAARATADDLQSTVVHTSAWQSDTPAIPTVTDLPLAALRCAETVVSAWSSKTLGVQEVGTLLERLAEPPLHTTAFSGVARVGTSYLLFRDGDLVGAFDSSAGTSGETVVEALPERADVALISVPGGLSVEIVSLLPLLLEPGAPLHRDLDSSFVNLPALARELAAQRFNGVIRLRRENELAQVLFSEGRSVLQLFSKGWEEAPLDRHWESWISDVKVRADVERLEPRLLFATFRLKLQNLAFNMDPRPGDTRAARSGASMLRRMLGSDSAVSGTTVRFDISPVLGTEAGAARSLSFQDDPMYVFLRWMTRQLPGYLQERKRAERWKYLVEWLPLIRRAVLHHDLPRPDSARTDLFDLVTTNDKGKVLHLADRVACGDLETLNRFIARVILAKTARIKTGDVGAACLIAPSFSTEAIRAYAAGKDSSGAGQWEMTLSEAITGYEGFVRLGPRRGFHLLLVREDGDGFEPILPDVVQEG